MLNIRLLTNSVSILPMTPTQPFLLYRTALVTVVSVSLSSHIVPHDESAFRYGCWLKRAGDVCFCKL